MIKACKACGEIFVGSARRKLYCSDACRDVAYGRRKETRAAEIRTDRKPYDHPSKRSAKKEADASLERIRQIEKAAAAAGMSYGKYVLKYGV